MSDNVFSAAAEHAHETAARAMAEAVKMVEADTKQVCPVDTGALKRSYTSGVVDEPELITGWVGSDVEYAVWADIKRPHLTLTVDADREAVTQMIANRLARG